MGSFNSKDEDELILIIITFLAQVGGILAYFAGAIVIIFAMGLVGLFWGIVLSFKNYLASFRENFNYQRSEL